jgi:cyclic pyranopterin phosphate synthase
MTQEKKSLSHLSSDGSAQMVDISQKEDTRRIAVARGSVKMSHSTFLAIQTGNNPKGDVLGIAKIAGIMAAKNTANLIPLCHPLPLHKIDVNIISISSLPGYQIEATAITEGKTGVEMEALTAVSLAALTLYDMAKAIDHGIEIQSIHLVSKTGGKSDYAKKE